MMTVTFLVVGSLGEKHWTQASAEYLKRLQAFCRPEVLEIPEHRLPQKPSPAEIAKAVEQEGKAILAKLPPRSFSVALCIQGRTLSSEELAETLQGVQRECSRLVFIIGGSHGLSKAVEREARLRLSMSPMTFPHQLARIMVLEQVYRAFSINAGARYHK